MAKSEIHIGVTWMFVLYARTVLYIAKALGHMGLIDEADAETVGKIAAWPLKFKWSVKIS